MHVSAKQVWIGLAAGMMLSAHIAMAAEAETAEPAAVMTTEEATALIQEKGYICMSCHQVEVKMVGPAYKDVGVKYKDADNEAKQRLATEIMKGKMENLIWGPIPMPANPTVTEEDANKLVAWVLSLGGEAAPEAAPEAAAAPEAEKAQ